MLGSHAPEAVAKSVVQLAGRLDPTAVLAAGSERGNEVIARVAAELELPFAANCVEAKPG